MDDKRRSTRAAGLLALAGLSLACSVERDRPADPTDPGLLERPVLAVHITHPILDQAFLRQTFTTPPGVQITWVGDLVDGHYLVIEAWPNDFTATPFFRRELQITAGEVPTAAFVLAPASELTESDRVRVRLSLLDLERIPVAVDSVSVRIQ